MDNLSAHKLPAIRQAIQAAGAKLLYLPPYSPDFNPIEQLFAKLKALLRKAAERSTRASGTALQLFSTLSRPMNVPTTSATPDVLRSKWKPL
jgi:transposase